MEQLATLTAMGFAKNEGLYYEKTVQHFQVSVCYVQHLGTFEVNVRDNIKRFHLPTYHFSAQEAAENINDIIRFLNNI